MEHVSEQLVSRGGEIGELFHDKIGEKEGCWVRGFYEGVFSIGLGTVEKVEGKVEGIEGKKE